MAALCPECSYVLYGYERCDHNFINGRCVKCHWDGSISDYGRTLKQHRAILNAIGQNQCNQAKLGSSLGEFLDQAAGAPYVSDSASIVSLEVWP